MLKFPVVVITVGHISKDRIKLFAGANEHGQVILPVFTDFVSAEKYKRYCEEASRRATLPFSVTGGNGDGVADLGLQLYVVKDTDHLSDIVKVAAVLTPINYVAIDPDSDSSKVLCLELDEFMSELNPDSDPSSEV